MHASVLFDLTLPIPANRTTAMVGPSGAGKTTVADLVLGLLQPGSGEILVDGQVLDAARRTAWRRRVGYVSQDGTLLSGTIRANLLWANPDADEEAMREAPELAAAPEFVGSLPDGLDTVVGERGALFSGGERQRLTLACALVRRPDLLVLDEATSTLDSANEGRVLEALRGFRGRMTVLIISHLPSAVGEADVIHVLEEGRWVESGSWDELTALDSGRFSQMARAQGVVS